MKLESVFRMIKKRMTITKRLKLEMLQKSPTSHRFFLQSESLSSNSQVSTAPSIANIEKLQFSIFGNLCTLHKRQNLVLSREFFQYLARLSLSRFIADHAASALVLGFSGCVSFTNFRSISPCFHLILISCTFLSTLGSEMILTFTFSR
jgi:hypothetical protein